MAAHEDLSSAFSREEFSGQVRLFPFPNLVLFPHVMQPLHVSEARYCALVREALETDRLIAMALLEPGWESDYEGSPPVCPVACLAKITAHHQLSDGSYNLLVTGLHRVRLLRELPTDKPFREARVEIHDDAYPVEQAEAAADLHRRLREVFLVVLPEANQAKQSLEYLLTSSVSLGMLTDVLSSLIDLDLEQKEALLAETNVYRRADVLLEYLSVVATAEDETFGALDFPPQFSAN